MNKKGSYFFVIDVFLAGAIVALTLIIIQNAQVTIPEAKGTIRANEQFSDFLTRTEIRDLQNEYVQELIDKKNITDLRSTLFEQAIQFYSEQSDLTTNYMANLTSNIPNNLGLMILINNTIIYNRSTELMNESDVLSSTKKLGFYRKGTKTIYGPLILEVRTWS